MVLVKEIRFPDVGEVEVGEVADNPRPGLGEALVAPSYVGICGSDLHVYAGRHPFVRPPVVTGHESIGEVLAIGDGVTGIDRGERVLINPLVHCGQCAACAAGALNTCESARVLGFKLPGTARTRTVQDASRLHRVPDAVATDVACLAEPLATAVHAVGRTHGPPALENVLVIGGGCIGLAVLLAARAHGAGRITLVEPVAAKRDLASRLGADRVVEPERLGELAGFTTAFDCVAGADTLRAAVAGTRGGGRVVVVGVPSRTELDLPLPRMQRFEVDLVGSGMYLPADIDSALSLIADGAIDPRPLISRCFPLADASSAYPAAADPDTVKVLVRLSD
ncbi:2-desacetyl-2-hydroxyethyl bacteriochlorophyllide A dehydrogenase [Prauserella sediminis]|uniref:2-desacetyl-2-hydroxyethyl bacteriochlorophyllide A dehydrogenase n=1 Tax=Prauserella sediminis TaxID=577680 RepID=A0A839XW38_9PSEU|nr:alcohol dehydrogenase catalytic domain-containing protein [Prauserella sediminis]MBB3664236.1 2-desacetyl-2-hydroxyethyl bacteriochlorophyllide A dehydrogenase [Prauserella sediminis]